MVRHRQRIETKVIVLEMRAVGGGNVRIEINVATKLITINF